MSRVAVGDRPGMGRAGETRSNGTSEPTSGKARSSGFRPDIQGLRAIAVAGVVIYHLWPHSLPGGFVGVDVFFVISGFLITSHLVRKPPRGPKDIIAFWARRVRRLLPASLLVLLVTVIVTFALAPVTTWPETGRQVTAAAGYFQNWYLAFQSVDYLAADTAATGVQHFWSLSVEEQFYFVWPIVIGVLAYLATRLRVSARWVLGPVVLALTLGFLGFAIWYTGNSPEMAYFITPARIWELMLGGLTAMLAAHRPASDSNLSTALAWLGLAGIAFSLVFINGDMPFPGYAAILPTASTALVIAAHASSRLSPQRVLSAAPMQFTGNTSYSIYLWHWPLIVLVRGIVDDVTWWQKLAVLAATPVLAWLTMVWVENRFRRSRLLSGNVRTFATAGIIMALVIAGGQGLSSASSHKEERSQQAIEQALASGDACFGAGKLLDPNADSDCAVDDGAHQDPVQAKNDKSEAYQEHCRSEQEFSDRLVCHYGNGPTKIALVGNSHAAHWLPALQKLAKQRGWTIDTYLASRCNPTTKELDFGDGDEKKSDGCLDYGKWVKKQTSTGDYDAIITSERQSAPVKGHTLDNTEDQAAEGYAPFLKAWHKAKTPVVAIRDSPFPKKKGVIVPDCVAKHGSSSPKCRGTEKDWRSSDPLAQAIKEKGYSRQHVVDPTHLFCPDGECKSVIGGVIVYFDGSHQTATYSKTMAPWLGKQLTKTGIRVLAD